MDCLSASLYPPPPDVDLINPTNLTFFHLSENWIRIKRKGFIKTKTKKNKTEWTFLSASLQPPPPDVDLINPTNLIFFHISENWIRIKRKGFIKAKK